MRRILTCSATFFSLIFPQAVMAQQSDNGTDPTKLRKMVAASYEHMELGKDATRGTFKLILDMPIADRTALRFTLPGVALSAPGVHEDILRYRHQRMPVGPRTRGPS